MIFLLFWLAFACYALGYPILSVLCGVFLLGHIIDAMNPAPRQADNA